MPRLVPYHVKVVLAGKEAGHAHDEVKSAALTLATNPQARAIRWPGL